MKRLNHRTRAVILTTLLFILLIAIYACGILIPEDAVTGSFLNAKQPPSLAHPFGTDALGRELLLRTLKGLSVSVTVGLAASAIGMEGAETINPVMSAKNLRIRAGL